MSKSEDFCVAPPLVPEILRCEGKIDCFTLSELYSAQKSPVHVPRRNPSRVCGGSSPGRHPRWVSAATRPGSDCRQLRRRSPSPEAGPGQVAWKSRANAHISRVARWYNDLSDYAGMLAVHMTNYYTLLTTCPCIVEERHSTGRIGAGGPHTHPGRPPTPPTVSAAPQHAWCWSRARGRQRAAQRQGVRAQRGRKSDPDGDWEGGWLRGGLAASLASLDSQTTPRPLETAHEMVYAPAPG